MKKIAKFSRIRMFLINLFMSSLAISAILAAVPFETFVAADPFSLIFPARPEDLPPGHYWWKSSEHGLAHDFVGVRNDTKQKKFTRERAGAQGGGPMKP